MKRWLFRIGFLISVLALIIPAIWLLAWQVNGPIEFRSRVGGMNYWELSESGGRIQFERGDYLPALVSPATEFHSLVHLSSIGFEFRYSMTPGGHLLIEGSVNPNWLCALMLPPMFFLYLDLRARRKPSSKPAANVNA